MTGIADEPGRSLAPEAFRAVMSVLPTAVSVVSAEENGRPIGMVMGTLTSVSLDPPLIAVLPMRSSSTWARIAATGRFVASILSGHQHDVVTWLSGRSDQRFDRVPWMRTAAGGPAIAGSLTQLDTEIEDTYGAGDHLIVVSRVVDAAMHDQAAPPLVFFRRGFHRTLPVQENTLHGWH